MTRGPSLRTKVPLYIFAGLSIVIAAWTWVAHRNIRAASLEVSRQHLEAVANQFAAAYQANSREWLRAARNAANATVVRQFVANRRPADSAVVHSLFASAMVGTVRRVELYAHDGSPLLSVSRSGEAPKRRPSLEGLASEASASPDFSILAPLQRLEDSVVAPAIATVLRDSMAIGYVVVARLVRSGSADARRTLSDLLGGSAELFVGNARGDLWLDITGETRDFPVQVPLDGSAAHYRRGDSSVVTAGRRVDGTPFALAVEMSDATALAPAASFLRRSLVLGLLTVTLATLGAWLLSRRTTHPLTSLTAAAQAMAAGDYSQRVRIDRGDEIGVLASSFNSMAQQVSDMHAAMEAKVNERTAQLQARNEDLEAFAHSVSHDLRAPLRAMHGFSQALLEDCADSMDETAKDYARRIAAASHRMDQLTQDLLTFSQVSRSEISLGPVDLDLVVRDAIGQLEADIATRKARVHLHGPFPRVRAHRATLEQALANLVSNGLKFVAPGAHPEIDVRTAATNGHVRVWVEDNGIGIDPAYHRRIFAVFERLHTPEQYAGTGIGLAIVRKAVERMGGAVGVESTPGKGSRFWIDLNVAEAGV
jgi:signal transduction histidine kinase